MASHASRFVKNIPRIFAPCAMLAGVALCQLLAPEASAATACSAASGKVMTQTPSIECPSGPTNCDPPIQAGVDPATQSGVGPLTKCIFSGDDPPVTLRPDLGTGSGITFSGMGSTLQAGKCPPPIGVNGGTVGSLNCPVTQVSGLPTIPPYLPVANPNLNQAPTCLTASPSSIPALPCGGAIALTTNMLGMANVSSASNISVGGGIFIGKPLGTVASGSVAINNSLASGTPGCGSNSILSLQSGSVNLVLPPTKSPISTVSTSGGYPTPLSGPPYKTYFNSMSTVSWSTTTDSTPGDIITLPEGGNYTDANGNILTFPVGAVLVNLGGGNVVWVNGGSTGIPPTVLQPVSSFGLGSFVSAVNTSTQPSIYPVPGVVMSAYCTVASCSSLLTATERSECATAMATGTAGCISDSHYIQQSLPISSSLASLLMSTPRSTLLPAGSVYTLNPRSPVTYLTGEYIPVKDPMIINTQAVATLTAYSAVSWPTSSIIPPTGSYLSVPLDTPISFAANTPGTMAFPAGGNIIGPDGSSIAIPQNGVITSLGTTGSGGAPQLRLPDGTVLTYWPGFAYYTVHTTEVPLPPGTALPMNLSASSQINLPQSTASAPPPSCR